MITSQPSPSLAKALHLTIICCLEALTNQWDRSDQGFINLIGIAESALKNAGHACDRHDYAKTDADQVAALYPEARRSENTNAQAPASERAVFDHAFDIAFSLRSHNADGSDVTAAHIRAALAKRITTLSDDELLEATGAPFDSYEV